MHIPLTQFRQEILEMDDDELSLLMDCWDSRSFNHEKGTENRKDKWLLLAMRILNYMERDDVADGIDLEYYELEKQLSIRLGT